jgi:hypothetical protein
VETVSFVTTERGKDLIVSFAVTDPEEPSEIDSLILLRTPVYEPFLEEWERGVKVFFDRDDPDEDDFLEEVRWDEEAAILHLKTLRHSYELDLRNVDGKSLSAMRGTLRKMNFDRSVQLSGF